MLLCLFGFSGSMQVEFMRKTGTGPSGRFLSSSTFVSFVVVIILLLSGCTIGRESKHPTWTTATGAEQYERLMWRAIRDKDWDGVNYHLAPTFVGIGPAGQSLDRTAWIEYWKADPVKEFSLAEVAVQPNGSDMTVSYLLHLDDRHGSGLRVLSIWQQVKKGWMLTATSMTPLTPKAEPSSSK
jgi:hypothetical protein